MPSAIPQHKKHHRHQELNANAYIAHSPAILELSGLPEMLGAPLISAKDIQSTTGQVVIGWGMKPSAIKAASFAAQHGLTFWRLEDGFLRSVGHGKNDSPLSIVVDDLGIYYDATTPSRLESLLQQEGWESAELIGRSRQAIEKICSERLSKYNHAPPLRHALPGLNKRKILLIDQTHGDNSITYGLAGNDTFNQMFSAAFSENPEADIIIKTHPDVIAGKKRGYLCHLKPNDPRVHILAADLNPISLLEQVDRVYVATSQMGLEALFLGKPVECFGMPFYAGWGLTNDRQTCSRRTRKRSLEELFAAAYILYPRYLDPESGERCEIERLIEWLSLQRKMRDRFPQEIYALDFSRWKRPIVRDFFQGSTVHFAKRTDKAPPGSTLAVWGRKPIPGKVPGKANQIHLEDGFLRSVGLGADLVRPLSWVMDRCGIYYDATTPSDLELLLLNISFDAQLCSRASALREALCRSGLTKYNVGAGNWQRPPSAQHVILVPGQVESDASIRFGAPGARTNLELLKKVRASNPHSYVIYKPHPDVVAGLRAKGEDESDTDSYCDEIVIDTPMGQMLEAIDEVHTLTSLAGFEALLRDKRVVTYGQPFYAGWGLTTDILPHPRRQRRLTIDELVAGVLILYPTYISRTTGHFTTPERALKELLLWREQGPTTLPLWRKAYRLIIQLSRKI